MDEFTQELESVPMVKHALAYARKGWHVFPLWWPEYPLLCACPKGKECPSPGKHPLTKNGVKDASLRADWVEAWWDRWPLANIGLACGKVSGFVVLDVDGEVGGDTMRKLLLDHGVPTETIAAQTGGGGRHVLWRWQEGLTNRIGFLPKLDVRSDEGHIVAPPSMHESGERYRWMDRGHPARVRLQPVPEWMAALMKAPKTVTAKQKGMRFPKDKPKPQVDIDAMQPFGEGERNDGLFRKVACSLLWSGCEDIAPAVFYANSKLCRPPLGDREVQKLIDSAIRRYPVGG